MSQPPRNLDELFAALARSPFRRKFKLGKKELALLRRKGLEQIMSEAQSIIRQRLAPAVIANDGRQTPWRNHPVFIAQHATATCCRKCLATWHGINEGIALSHEEQAHVLSTIERWLRSQDAPSAAPGQGFLF